MIAQKLRWSRLLIAVLQQLSVNCREVNFEVSCNTQCSNGDEFGSMFMYMVVYMLYVCISHVHVHVPTPVGVPFLEPDYFWGSSLP